MEMRAAEIPDRDGSDAEDGFKFSAKGREIEFGINEFGIKDSAFKEEAVSSGSAASDAGGPRAAGVIKEFKGVGRNKGLCLTCNSVNGLAGKGDKESGVFNGGDTGKIETRFSVQSISAESVVEEDAFQDGEIQNRGRVKGGGPDGVAESYRMW